MVDEAFLVSLYAVSAVGSLPFYKPKTLNQK